MSIETYEQIIGETQIDYAIAEAEAEYEKSAELIDAKEALASLRRK